MLTGDKCLVWWAGGLLKQQGNPEPGGNATLLLLGSWMPRVWTGGLQREWTLWWQHWWKTI